jgi:glycosyltransferase involved in cell wall biosynthesis
MRVLLVTKSLSFLGGGAERILVDVAGGLADRGHEVAIATFDEKHAESFYPLSKKVAFCRLSVGNTLVQTGLIALGLRARALQRFAKTLKPDVAVGFLHSSYVPLSLGLANSNVPVIASEHIVFTHYGSLPVQRLALRMIVPLVRAVTAVTETMRSSFPPAMRSKMHVIPNPISQSHKLADVVGGAQKTLLSVGRLEPQKDHATLIAAFSMIAEEFPDWILRIVGEGSLRGTLERQARSLGLQRRVELPGSVRDIAQEYVSAQLFVMPSLYESFGLATAEALSHGLPAIGFADCPGTNDLIEDGLNGVLAVGRGSAEGLAAALARLMSSSDLRVQLGCAAPQTVSQFKLDVVLDRWEQLLHQTARQTALGRPQQATFRAARRR